MPSLDVKPEYLLNLNQAEAEVWWSVDGVEHTTLQADVATGSWGSAVLTIERSNDGQRWYALPSPTTMTAAGMTAAIACGAWGYMRARVTTAAGGAGVARLSAYGTANA